jgi:hypothetical protein
VTLVKYRPDEILVDLACEVDIDWMVNIQPQMIKFSEVGTRTHQFWISLAVPPMIVGPLMVTVDVTASARLVGRSLTAATSAVVNFIEDSDQFMDNVPRRITVHGDGGVDGQMRVYNHLDRQMEVHLCALGEWETLIPDLDFQQSLVLAPNQIKEVRFHGQLDDGIGTGEYDIELALWTPGVNGSRTYITSKNVTLVVTREESAILGKLIVLSLVVLFVGVGVLLYILFMVLRGGLLKGSLKGARGRLFGIVHPEGKEEQSTP